MYVRRIADALMVEQRIVTYSSHVQTQFTKVTLDRLDEGGAEEGIYPAGIEAEPIRVLDAPGLVDDFYLNVLHWSPHYQDRSFLAVGLGEKIWSYDMSTARANCIVALHGPAASVAWNPEIAHVAMGTKDGTVVYQRSTKRAHEGRVGVLAWRDGQVLATAGKDAHVMLHDFRTAEPVVRVQAHRQEVCGLAWDAAKNFLATGGNDNTVHVWDIRNMRKPSASMMDHTAAVKAVAWSPHQRGLLATGGGTADKTIRLWTPSSNSKSAHVLQTSSQICTMAWNPFRNELLTTHGFSDNHLVLWSRRRAVCAPFRGHLQRVLYLAVAPVTNSSPWNGVVATASGDETVKFWKVFRDRTSNNKRCLLNSP